MNMNIKSFFASLIIGVGIFSANAIAAEEKYAFDIRGQHAFIQFKVQHLGYSWLLGNVNTFDGSFTYDDAHPDTNKVQVEIDMNSLDSNHAERDKHLRSADFFDVAQYPKAMFTSTAYKDLGQGKAELQGVLELHGVSKNITIALQEIGHGGDPWGGYRRGFEGRTMLKMSDFNFAKGAMLGAAAEHIELFLSIEGVRQ